VETFGRYAYTANTGSGTVTGFRIGHDGTLTLLDEDGVTATTGAGSTPRDMDIALRYLYVHSAASSSIEVYRIEGDGGLTAIPGAASGLPPTSRGVAAY
jgi:6-phosphogluconolactonase (cycloisomerase 2 family)